MYDRVIKKIFRNKKFGKELTARIVSSILKQDYKLIFDHLVLTSEEIAFDTRTVDSKADMVLEDDSIIVNVEINYKNGPYRNAQMNSYVYQLYLNQIVDSDSYLKVKKVIQIIIETKDYFKRNEFMYNVVYMEKNLHIVEDEKIEKFRINIANLVKSTYNDIKRDPLKYLLYFLVCNDDARLEEIYGDDDFMKEVIKESKKIAGTLKVPLYYPLTDEEVEKLDEQYFINQGIQQGKLQEKSEIVINLFKKDIPIKTIAECASLTTDEVKNIINENKS